MKVSKLLSWSIFSLLTLVIILAVLVNLENRLKKEISSMIEKNEMLDAKDINIRIFKHFPKIGVELEGATVYLRKDKRVKLKSPSIIAYVSITRTIKDYKNYLNNIDKIESSQTKIFVNRSEKFQFVSNYNFCIENQNGNYLLKSKLQDLTFNGKSVEVPEINLNGPFSFDIAKQKIEFKDVKLVANGVEFEINSFLTKDNFELTGNRIIQDSAKSKLIFPHFLFDNIENSEGNLSLQSKFNKKAYLLNYKAKNAILVTEGNNMNYNVEFDYTKRIKNFVELDFEIENISNIELKHLRYFQKFSAIHKFFKGSFHLDTKAKFQLDRSIKLKLPTLDAKGSFNSKECEIVDTEIQKYLAKKFSGKYSKLKLKNIQANYEIKKGDIHIKNCSFLVDKMKWSLTGKINKKANIDMVLNLRLPLSDIKFDESTQAILDFAISTGFVKKTEIVELDVEISGTTSKPILKVDISKVLSKYTGIKDSKTTKEIENSINDFLNDLLK